MGRKGCPGQGKGLFLSGQCMWIKFLGRDMLSSTDQVCPCNTQEIVCSLLVPNAIDTSMHFLTESCQLCEPCFEQLRKPWF